MEISHSKQLPYSADEMYALVNNINAYPDFLPWCTSAVVTEESQSHLVATVGIAAGKVKQKFTTENSMRPGRFIEMRLVEGPFKYLHGEWNFVPISENACTISLGIEFEFKSKLLKLALSSTFNKIMNSMVESFTQRAREIYGNR
jgi:ribosome-associated toxin RatA of RatAB toxin-antitoxin module